MPEEGSKPNNWGKPFRTGDEAQIVNKPIERSATASAEPATQTVSAATARVTVVNFDIPFWKLVGLLVMLAFASIPAVIIIVCTAMIAGAIVGVFLAIVT